MVAAKFLDPKNDFAFKQIFGTEKNKSILVHFLNDILEFPEGEKVREVSFLRSSQDPEVAAKKQSIVDVLCRDEKGVQYIVEMQVARTPGFAKRAQYYAAKTYANQMNNGGVYHHLKQVIFLAITDFVMFPEKKGYKSDHVILDKESYERDLKDFSFTFLELPKFDRSAGELSSMVEKWMYFFKHAPHTEPQELEKLIGSDLIIRQAYTALDQFYWTEEQLNAYEREKKSQLDAQALLEGAEAKGVAKGRVEGRAEGHAEGHVKGHAEGRIEAMKEVAKKMLAQGLTTAAVSSMTGLTQNDLKDL